MTFSMYERSNSIGESSKSSHENGSSNNNEHVRTLNFNERVSSPQPMRFNHKNTNHIMKSKSGHSLKSFEK
jgi:hypothetical protein